MDELLEILEDLAPGTDFETCTTLIDDHILDSFAILSLVSEIEDAFDVEVSPAELVPANLRLPRLPRPRTGMQSMIPFMRWPRMRPATVRDSRLFTNVISASKY